MMTDEDLKALAHEIAALGYDHETAKYWAALIGDTPIVDEDGLLVVVDEDGTVLARLKLDYFNEEE